MVRVHGDTGWMIRGLTAVVVVGVLATARPERSWAWGVLGVGFLAWLAGSHLMTRDQRGSLVLLVFACISASLIVGMPGANALVIALRRGRGLVRLVVGQGGHLVPQPVDLADPAAHVRDEPSPVRYPGTPDRRVAAPDPAGRSTARRAAGRPSNSLLTATLTWC